jgi:hypothetical protein
LKERGLHHITFGVLLRALDTTIQNCILNQESVYRKLLSTPHMAFASCRLRNGVSVQRTFTFTVTQLHFRSRQFQKVLKLIRNILLINGLDSSFYLHLRHSNGWKNFSTRLSVYVSIRQRTYVSQERLTCSAYDTGNFSPC